MRRNNTAGGKAVQHIKNIYHEFQALFFSVAYWFFIKMHHFPEIASIEETVDKLILEHKSMARFGDGEIKWILNLPQDSFQQQNDKLQAELIKVLTVPTENCLIALPPEMTDMSTNTKDSKRFWQRFFVQEGAPIIKYLDVSRKYYNTDVSRCYINYLEYRKAEERFENLKRLWQGRDVLIVEGEKTRLGIGNDLFDHCASIRRILAPAKNAYNVYEKIVDAALQNTRPGDLILLALGPTATILAYDLSQKGMQAVDIGHVDIEYEWYRMRTRKKVAIKGKYVNEAGAAGKVVENETDVHYLEQIICRVGE